MTKRFLCCAALTLAILAGCGGPKSEEPAVGKNEGEKKSAAKKDENKVGEKNTADDKAAKKESAITKLTDGKSVSGQNAAGKADKKSLPPLKKEKGNGLPKVAETNKDKDQEGTKSPSSIPGLDPNKSVKKGPDPDKAKSDGKNAPKVAKKVEQKKGPPAPTLEELLQAAQQAITTGQLEEGIKQLREVAKLSPKHPTRMSLVELLQRHGVQVAKIDPDKGYGMLREAAVHLRELVGDKDVNPQFKALVAQTYYNEACALAREKQIEPAFKSLELSVTKGFATSEFNINLLKTDTDLDNLHKDPRFAKIVSRVEQEYKTRIEKAISDAEEAFAKFEPFKFSFELPDTDAKPVSSMDFGDKVLIVNFWGVWAPPSRNQVKDLIKLKGAHAGKGLEIVGINYERVPPAQARQAVAQFRRVSGMNYPSLFGDRDTAQKLPLQKVPTTLLIDRAGKVRMKFESYQPYEVLNRLTTTLLKEPTPKKADTKKADTKKADTKKADTKKADTKKADTKKADTKKADTKKADTKKADTKKADTKKADTKKADTKKADTKKADTKKADTKKADTKKADTKKADQKKG